MGEIADEHIDRMLDEGYGLGWRRPLRPGRWRRVVTCARCGASGLLWKEMREGWRLYDGGVLHQCAAADLLADAADDFDVVESASGTNQKDGNMNYRTLTDDELRARFTVAPDGTELRDEILRRFERDQIGADLRQRIAELEEEMQELKNDLAERDDN